jgi:hypothetical protein
MSAWAALPQRWLHIDLPGYRQHEGIYTTYCGFPFDELPQIPISLDDNCDWLLKSGTPVSPGLDRYERQLQPAIVRDLAAQLKIKLPKSFERFMCSPELQERVRSCTDCYLDPGERIVETIGAIPGHLIHFLSDSQSCAHWYVHVLPEGNSAVLESEDLYCYRIENSDWIENPACRLEKFDLTTQDFAYCAPTFSEFPYRFWIENEIWFATYEETRRPLTPLEENYVHHYESLRRKV